MGRRGNLILFFMAMAAQPTPQKRYFLERIRQQFLETANRTGRRVPQEKVMAAMSDVPRSHFVPDAMRAHAHDDRALPIGHGQTISQPFIVALMTDLLDLHPRTRVLEVGTGSGYQAAILAQLAEKVYSVELEAVLSAQAKQRLHGLGIENVELRVGDGAKGWPEAAPFDGILVTAAARRIPEDLVDQLAFGGRMVLPLRRMQGWQDLVLVEKDLEGHVSRRTVLAVTFVPLR